MGTSDGGNKYDQDTDDEKQITCPNDREKAEEETVNGGNPSEEKEVQLEDQTDSYSSMTERESVESESESPVEETREQEELRTSTETVPRNSEGKKDNIASGKEEEDKPWPGAGRSFLI